MTSNANARETGEFDYIIVGSGAGGAPLAARLAEAGFCVLVMEAGSDALATAPTTAAREVSDVPALHAVSTEHPDLSWQFLVKHYTDPPTGPDPKNLNGDGIFYPRAAALGGCTVHNALITIAGPDSDWDDLADFVNDDSWRSEVMRTYFQRLEQNEYLQRPSPPPKPLAGRFVDNLRWLFGFGPDYTGGRHGFERPPCDVNGKPQPRPWLRTSWADISLGLHDIQLIKMLKAAFKQVKCAGIQRFGAIADHFLHGRGKESLDPNHSVRQAENPAGLAVIPIAVCGINNPLDQNAPNQQPQRGRRSSPRALLLEVKSRCPENLVIWTECFVTKVLFEEVPGKPPRAVGVEYFKGGRLYEAHPGPRNKPGAAKQVRANREVILCGGSFNTPQLLMLSGIGDRAHLEKKGTRCLVDLCGVGRNLHDRYEVTVLSEMDDDFAVLDGATFQLPADPASPDPVLAQWRNEGAGLYTSNGAVIGILKRSRPELAQPDLFIFGIPLPFQGYEIGYSDIQRKYGDKHRRLFTWAILKGHTRNRDGTVTLRSANPLERPVINFHYFHETSWEPEQSANDPDLLALVDGVKFVRAIAKRAEFVKSEFHPGPAIASDQQIKDWIRREAWGHHACGTCRMGPDGDTDAVLDSRFRVRGVSGLRVVDASIFPKIPGYFIVTNIYTASEKAADVIREDAQFGGADSAVYPRDLRREEIDALKTRRDKVRPPAGHPDDPPLQPVNHSEPWPKDVTGLALSGGGVRSATLNLGILQSLARKNLLRRADFLSTVSGGGYIGSFLGMFFDRLRHSALSDPARAGAQPAPDRIERELVAHDSPEIAWLRRHGNYIIPNGGSDARYNLAVFLRNLFSVHFVVGALVFAVFGLANAVRYKLFDPASAAIGTLWSVSGTSLPLGYLLQRGLGVFWSPWFALFELLLLFLVLPRVVGYWIASQDKHERYARSPLAVVLLFVCVLFYLSVGNGLVPPLLFLVLSLVSSFLCVEIAWWRGRIREEAVGSDSAATQRLRTRNYLTDDLGLALAASGMALCFALIDTTGHGLHQWLAGNKGYVKAFAKIGAAVVAIVPVLRGLADFFATGKKKSGPPSTLARIFRTEVMAGLLALVLLAVPLVFFSFASHAAYQGGNAFTAGISATVFALIISFILANPGALPFVNRSSLATTYASRLARAYLGASNPLRHHPGGADISEVMSSDDVGSIREYRPHESGGPFHIVNMTVNQTVDFNSQRGNRDRKGEILAVSCFGLTVGKTWHSLWTAPLKDSQGSADDSSPGVAIKPVGRLPGTEHPLVDECAQPTQTAEMLSLRQWIGISGAAVGPGRGQSTVLGTALLFGLANLRTGYWWDSGIIESARDGFPKLSFSRRLLYLVPRVFITQSLLIFEWIARYPGPWERFWYLSDGGFFENLATYELIRRRVPRIIVTDGGADPDYEFQDFANLVRKARIDLNASIEPFTAQDFQKANISTDVQALLGTFDDLRPPKDAEGNIIGLSKKHAALFWVRYKDSSRSILLYLKATVTSDMTADIANYHETHPEFPHENTGDQFFEEEQWESYRQLGENMAGPLFKDRDWFWRIPL